MKLTVISLLFLLMPLASALAFEFNAPDSAAVDANFSTSISAAASEDYDVKIFVQDNETKITLSEIYSEGWKNPYYYLKAVFPDKSDFIIRIKNSSDNAVICARLRKTGGSSYNEECKNIKIIGANSQSPNEQIPEQISNSNTSAKSQNLIANGDFVPSGEKEQFSQLNKENTSEKIFLNSGQNSKTVFITKDEKLRIYAVYAFTALAIIAIIFLVMKKL